MTVSPIYAKSVTVSIVSHGQQSLIVPLLQQLQTFCGSLIAKVVLTVNKPEPDLVGSFSWTYPLDVHVNREPRGFGANHNAAFQRCETDWFLVLNPDIRLQDDALSPLINAAHSNTGLLAPRITEPGKAEPEPYRGLVTPWEIFRRRLPGHLPPIAPAWIPGMFMLFRTEAYSQLEGFSPRFFMYGEDFDICARARLMGWQFQVCEHVNALHAAQRDSHRSLRPLMWHITSLLKVWSSQTFWLYRTVLSARSQN